MTARQQGRTERRHQEERNIQRHLYMFNFLLHFLKTTLQANCCLPIVTVAFCDMAHKLDNFSICDKLPMQ